jgi:hypothetical protein
MSEYERHKATRERWVKFHRDNNFEVRGVLVMAKMREGYVTQEEGKPPVAAKYDAPNARFRFSVPFWNGGPVVQTLDGSELLRDAIAAACEQYEGLSGKIVKIVRDGQGKGTKYTVSMIGPLPVERAEALQQKVLPDQDQTSKWSGVFADPNKARDGGWLAPLDDGDLF